MIKKGYEMTCSGCGISKFVDSSTTPRKLSFKEGSRSVDVNPNQSESWVIVHELFDLCPRCAKIREEMLCKFYEECGAARDKETTENG